MTHLEFNFTDMYGEPATGTITFTPVRNNRHSHGVTLPEPFAKNLGDNGNFTVDLKPTAPHWVWRINLQVNELPWTTNYYYVPDRNWPIRYEDLTPVDPSTVQTNLNPEPAWWEAVRTAKASADEISELAHSVRLDVSEFADSVGPINEAAENALNQIDQRIETVTRVNNRSEEILAEIRRHYTEIVGN